MMPPSILFIFGVVLGVHSQSSIFVPCEDTTPSPYTGPPLPVFPDQYQTSVEANIVQKNYTMDLDEYYDYTNNRFSSTHYNRLDGSKVRRVSRTEDDEVRIIYSNGTCHVRHINTTGMGFFSFVSGPNGTHVRSIKDLMAFGSEYGEKYMGVDRVRGILVDHWQSCLKYKHAEGNFTLDFYFTKDTNYSVNGQSVRVPVRAALKGIGQNMRNRSAGVHSFNHVYEFTNFHAGPIMDQEVFEIPPGVFCNGSMITKTLPDVPAHFSSGVEQVVDMGDDHTELPMTLYMDQSAEVMRLDLTAPLTPQDMMKFGQAPLTYISDSNHSLLYIIDQWEENCTVIKSVGRYQELPSFTVAEQFLAMFKGDFVYQSKKMFRGFSAESWAYINETSKDFTELFFHQMHGNEGGPSRPRRVPAPGRPISGQEMPLILVGVLMKTSTPVQQEKTIHFYGFNPSHPAPEVFDVSRCYSLGHHYVYMAFKVTVDYGRDVYFRKREFVSSVRSAIARGAGVSLTRITAILAEQNPFDSTQVVVYFKLLDNQVIGLNSNDGGPTLDQAKLSLSSAVANGLNFDVQYKAIEQNFEVVKDTLWEVMTSNDPGSDYSSSLRTYSPGSMAGLGIGMLVVGAILGLLGAFVIYKRVDSSVPYRVTQ